MNMRWLHIAGIIFMLLGISFAITGIVFLSIGGGTINILTIFNGILCCGNDAVIYMNTDY